MVWDNEKKGSSEQENGVEASTEVFRAINVERNILRNTAIAVALGMLIIGIIVYGTYDSVRTEQRAAILFDIECSCIGETVDEIDGTITNASSKSYVSITVSADVYVEGKKESDAKEYKFTEMFAPRETFNFNIKLPVGGEIRDVMIIDYVEY